MPTKYSPATLQVLLAITCILTQTIIFGKMKLKKRIFYGWFVVAISMVIMTIVYGVYYSWPVFYVAILDEFGWSRGITAIIFSVASTVYAFASPISGFLFDKFGLG